MATQAIRGRLGYAPQYPTGIAGGVPNVTTVALNAVGHKAGQLFQYPKAGNVTHIEFYVAAVVGASGTAALDARLETRSAGLPSGTLAGTTSNGAVTVNFNDDNTWQSVALTTALTVTEGQLGALSIDVTAFVVVTSIQLQIFADDRNDSSYSTLDSGAGHVKDASSRPLCVALRYSDGSRYPIDNILPIKSITTTTYNNGSATRKMALRFKVAAPLPVNSFWLWLDFDGDLDAVLYDSDGSTVRLTTSFSATDDNAAAANIYRFKFSGSYTIAKDTYYYLSIVPSTATSLSVYDYTVETGRLDAADCGVDFHLATHNGTIWTTEADRRLFAGIGISGADDGAGGGSGGPRFGPAGSLPAFRGAA